MKILYYSNFVSYGGGERYLADLAILVSQAGHDTFFIGRTDQTFGYRREELIRSGVACFTLVDNAGASSITALIRLVRYIRRLNPDVVHINECRIGVLAARFCGKPVFGTFHTPERFESAGIHIPRAINSVFTNMYTGIIAISKRGENLVRTELQYRGCVSRINIGQEIPSRSIELGELKHFAVVGRLDIGHKGQDMLLRAWGKLDSEGRTLTLIGDGPDRELLEDLSRSLALSNVHFTGFSKNVLGLLRNIDCLIVSSHFEGTPYVILEAMSLGLPIVSTSVGAIDDMITDGETGLLCSPTEDDLASGIRRIIELPKHELTNMVERSRQRLKEHYSPQMMQTQTLRLYAEAGSGRKGG